MNNDVIEPVRESSAWVSPIVPVRKPNGALRLCVDYRKLSEHDIRERHMLPTVEEIGARLDGAKVFSVLDAESGFHQTLLDKSSRSLTTFATHDGLYRLNACLLVLPALLRYFRESCRIFLLDCPV